MKELTFDFKESKENHIQSFIKDWTNLLSETTEMTLDLAAISESMKPKINNNWSRKRKNETSKPCRRKVRQIRNLMVDKLITEIQVTSESLVDSDVIDITVSFEQLGNPPKPNQALEDLFK